MFVADNLPSEYRDFHVLRASFWIKLSFIITEVVLAIVFAATSFTHKKNIAAYFEWVIAFIFTFYILSFVVDLWPARHTRRHSMRYSKRDLALGAVSGNGTSASPREMEENTISNGSMPLAPGGGPGTTTATTANF